jgi:hypothetical protein
MSVCTVCSSPTPRQKSSIAVLSPRLVGVTPRSVFSSPNGLAKTRVGLSNFIQLGGAEYNCGMATITPLLGLVFPQPTSLRRASPPRISNDGGLFSGTAIRDCSHAGMTQRGFQQRDAARNQRFVGRPAGSFRCSGRCNVDATDCRKKIAKLAAVCISPDIPGDATKSNED